MLEYCTKFHPAVIDKFGQLLVRLPEIRLIAMQGEEYFFYCHLSQNMPEHTLLMEMIKAHQK